MNHNCSTNEKSKRWKYSKMPNEPQTIYLLYCKLQVYQGFRPNNDQSIGTQTHMSAWFSRIGNSVNNSITSLGPNRK